MLTRVLRTVRVDTIDKRSQAGVFMRRLREALVAQLGGDVSPAQELLIEEVVKKALITRAVGEYILRQGQGAQDNLIQNGRLLPVVVQHDQLQSGLARLLAMLGLERRHREVDIAAQLAAMHRPGTPQPAEDRAEPPVSAVEGADATQTPSTGSGGEPEPTPR